MSLIKILATHLSISSIVKSLMFLANGVIIILIFDEYLHILQPSAWGIIFTVFVAALSLGNIKILLENLDVVSEKINSLLYKLASVLAVFMLLLSSYFIYSYIDINKIDGSSAVFGSFSILMLAIVYLRSRLLGKFVAAAYEWMLLVGNGILLFMSSMRDLIQDEQNTSFFLLLTIAFFLNTCFLISRIWGELPIEDELRPSIAKGGYIRRNIKNIIFYSLLTVLLVSVYYFPAFVCDGGELCRLLKSNEVIRAIYVIPPLTILYIIRGMRTQRLFLEFAFMLSICGGIGYLLGYHEIVEVKDVHFLNDRYMYMFLGLIWLVGVVGLLSYQAILTPFRRRALIYLPIIITSICFGIVGGTIKKAQDTPQPPVIVTQPYHGFL